MRFNIKSILINRAFGRVGLKELKTAVKDARDRKMIGALAVPAIDPTAGQIDNKSWRIKEHK